MTDGYTNLLSDQHKINKQAKSIIRGLIVRRVFNYYQIPNVVYFALDTNAESRLMKYLQQLHTKKGENASEEELKQEINNINTLIDEVIEEIITKEKNND